MGFGSRFFWISGINGGELKTGFNWVHRPAPTPPNGHSNTFNGITIITAINITSDAERRNYSELQASSPKVRADTAYSVPAARQLG